MTGLADLGAEQARRSGTDSDDDSDSGGGGFDRSQWWDQQYDVSGLPWVKMHPTTAVRGTIKAVRFYATEETNYQRGYYGLVLNTPTTFTGESEFEGTTIVADTDDENGDDYKIVNVDDETTKLLDSGVDFDGNIFYGDEVDGFQHDEIVVKVSGGTGRSIASTLDVKGAGGAHSIGSYNNEDVELHDGGFPKHSGHLMEYDPDEDGEMPRMARDPELRPDVEGKEIIVMIQRLADIQDDYDGDSYWSTVLVETDEDVEGGVEVDGTTFVPLEPTDQFEPSEDNLRAEGFIAWNRVPLTKMNQARVEEGLPIYVPEDTSVEDATPEGVDATSVGTTGPGA